MIPNAEGGEGVAGSQPVQRSTWSPKELWRYNSIFNLRVRVVKMQCWNVLGLHSSIIQHSGIWWPFRRLNTNKTQKITPLSNKLCLINVGIPGVGKGNQQNICQAVGKSTYRIRPLGLPLLTIHIAGRMNCRDRSFHTETKKKKNPAFSNYEKIKCMRGRCFPINPLPDGPRSNLT